MFKHAGPVGVTAVYATLLDLKLASRGSAAEQSEGTAGMVMLMCVSRLKLPSLLVVATLLLLLLLLLLSQSLLQ